MFQFVSDSDTYWQNIYKIVFSESTPKFREHFVRHHFTHLGRIFDRVVAKNPELASEILNSKLNNENSVLQLDLSPFYKIPKSPPEPETLSTIRMIERDRDDLIRNPLTESFVHLKWKKVRNFFYVSLIYRILYAVCMTVAVIFVFGHNKTISQWNKNR